MNILRSNILALTLIILLPFTTSLSIGLTPADVTFENVLRGGYAEMAFSIRTDSEENVSIILTDRTDSPGQEWVSYEPDPEFVTISRDNPYVGKVIVNVPEDAPLSNFVVGKGMTLRNAASDVDGDTVAQVAVSVGQDINFTITDEEDEECSVRSATIEDRLEVGEPLESSINIHNTGNIEANTRMFYTIETLDGQTVDEIEEIISTNPTEVKQESYELNPGLDVGQYEVSLEVPSCNYEKEPILLSVFEPGELIEAGTLLQVKTPIRVQDTPTVNISSEFINEGEKDVEAQFRGEVVKDGETVGIIESEPIRVSPGQSVSLPAEFSPQDVGRHRVKGKVYYGNKVSYEKSSIVNVLQLQDKDGFFTVPKLVLSILVISSAVIFFIRRKK